MGRPKSSSAGGSSGTASSSGGHGSSKSDPVPANVKLKDMLKDLYKLIHQVEEERSRSEHNLSNITKTHERMQQEAKVSPYFKTKLKGLYSVAMQDADMEAELLKKSLEKLVEVKTFREKHNGDRPKQILRRGVLMSMLQQNALTLPLWIGKPGERPPPLCGSAQAENNFICKKGDKVAARVRAQDGEENWILAEVVSYTSSANKYDVDDIDAEEGKERHTLSKRRVVPLPIYKANPETDPDALFAKDTLVLALYPQTTCFYRALVHTPPEKPSDDYSVLFEDTSYDEGYSPPLSVGQRYVIMCKDDKKK